MKKVLITGAAGFLGSNLAHWILNNVDVPVQIYGTDNLSGGFAENFPKSNNAYFYQTDASDTLGESFDYVFHFAAYAAEVLSPFIRKFNYMNNLITTIKLINNLINGGLKPDGTLVFSSSIAVYGDGQPPFSVSNSSCNPNDPYGVAKLACEHDIHIASRQHQLRFCILRLFNVYGPRQNIWDRYRNVLGLWMRAALEKKEAVIYGGHQVRGFTFIDDILPGIWVAATNPDVQNGTYNLGGRPIPISALVDAFKDALGQEAPSFTKLPPREEVKVAFCDVPHEEIFHLGRTPHVEGIRRMWDWAKEAWRLYPDRRDDKNRRPSIEVYKGLPEYWRY